MKPILSFFRFFYCLYAFLWFLILLIGLTPGILLAALLTQPQSGNLVNYLCRFWSFTWFGLIGILHQNVYSDKDDPAVSYVFVANHISYLDIPVIFRAIRPHMIRVLGKAEMARIPLFGTLYKMAVVMVDRSSTENRARSLLVLKKMLQRQISVFIFPEGTFNESGQPLKAFYPGAFQLAIETNTPIRPVVFLGTHRLMHYRSVWTLRPGICRAIHLPAIPVEGLSVKDVSALMGQVHRVMERTIIEYQLKENRIAGTNRHTA
jgi:1-acyl-sn-glycerol-3-phosphate acyltransferase